MGTWSTGIFDDDLARDIQREYDYQTIVGKEPHAVAKKLLAQHQDSLEDSDERIVVLAALASLLLDTGVRADPVMHEALAAIDAGEGLERWEEAGDEDLAERKAALNALANNLRRSLQIAKRFPKPLRCPRLKVGNVLQIPLLDGGFAYAHYVLLDPKKGPLVAILADAYPEPVPMDSLDLKKYLFPPVICGVRYAVREGMWQIIGWAPTDHFVYPLFRSGNRDKQGVIHLWWLWDGVKETRIGTTYPPEYEGLESLTCYPPSLVEERIARTLKEQSKNP